MSHLCSHGRRCKRLSWSSPPNAPHPHLASALMFGAVCVGGPAQVVVGQWGGGGCGWMCTSDTAVGCCQLYIRFSDKPASCVRMCFSGKPTFTYTCMLSRQAHIHVQLCWKT